MDAPRRLRATPPGPHIEKRAREQESRARHEQRRECLERKPDRLVVDLSGVSYIDSSGLAVLIEAMQNVEAYGGRFFLAGLQEKVRPIFEIARLDQVFIIFPHVDAALAAS